MKKIEASIRLALYGAGATKEYVDEITETLMVMIKKKCKDD